MVATVYSQPDSPAPDQQDHLLKGHFRQHLIIGALPIRCCKLNVSRHEASTGQRNFDHLLVNIFDDLSGELIHTVQSATHQILDISENFLEEDVSNAINDFHALYEKNVALDTYKESIGKNIDDIIRYIQDGQAGDTEMPDLSEIDTPQLEASRLSLSNMQKDMEALARLDGGMKERVLPILHNLQFEDQLSANILIITDAWKIFVAKTDSNNSSAAEILITVYANLSSEKIRQLFCQHVLNSEVGTHPTRELSSKTIETFVASLIDEDDFFKRIQIFCSSVLDWSTEDSAGSVEIIFDVIKTVEQEAADAGDFSDDTQAAFSNLKDIAHDMTNPQKRESTKIMISLLQNRVSLNDSVQSLINPVMIAMQFQDRIRQNMENLSKTMKLWLEKRRELANVAEELAPEDRQEIGVALMDFMTMESERKIIKKHIPETPNELVASSEDLELF